MQMRSLGAAVLAAGALLSGGAAPALATGGGNDTSAKLRKAVTVEGIKLHEAAFSLAAVATGGNRLAGTQRPRALGGLRRAPGAPGRA